MSLASLRIVLGDQLDINAALIQQAEDNDVFWMAELPEEQQPASSQARCMYFLSAMRHFAKALEDTDKTLHYLRLGEHPHHSIEEALSAAIAELQPQSVVMTRCGDLRVQAQIEASCSSAQCPLTVLEDEHFYTTPAQFKQWLKARKAPRMEHFYREQRKRYGILLDEGKPCGGKWNYDSDNRKSFGKKGPGAIPPPQRFVLDKIRKEVQQAIVAQLHDHPGSTEYFDWPVTAKEAEQALEDFIEHRLIAFGHYQDAMWTQEPWLYHARLSAAMNLKLLPAKKVVSRVELEYRQGRISLSTAEGFIRQILGWREYIRGLYFSHREQFFDNSLHANQPLPNFYWHGDTGMRCLAESINQTLDYGYAHHIQRLMVTGLFSLLLGVKPEDIHRWYLAVYVDAIEWVELPNTLGMSQYSDGGLTASKPYIATGKYIQRMSNYCEHCQYRPEQRSGEQACPFTVLYWDFLARHEARFAKHPRMALQCRNLDRIPAIELREIQSQADAIRCNTESL